MNSFLGQFQHGEIVDRRGDGFSRVLNSWLGIRLICAPIAPGKSHTRKNEEQQ